MDAPEPVTSDLFLPNFSAIAGFYSQLAGVLAGFAFAGLIALLAAQLSSPGTATAALKCFVPLISAFVGLVGSSLNYGIIAGEGGEGGSTHRAAMLETIGGLGFSVAGVMLFYSLLILMHGVLEDAGRTTPQGALALRGVAFVRAILILGIVPAIQLLLYGGFRDQIFIQYGGDPGLTWLDWMVYASVLSIFAWGVFCIILNRNSATAAGLTSPVLLSTAAIILALSSVAGTVVALSLASPTSLGWGGLPIIEVSALLIFNLYTVHWAAKYK